MGVKIRFLFFSQIWNKFKKWELDGYFLLVKRLFINIFFSLSYYYKGMKLATPIQFFIKTF